MPDSFVLLLLVVLLAIAFEFVNGFHDAANAIATSVSTRVLSPRTAIIMAAVLNLAGALSGTAVAKAVGAGLVSPVAVTQITIVSALLSAILWDLLTWYFGLPTSSSHALMASIVGAGIATAGATSLLPGGSDAPAWRCDPVPLVLAAIAFFFMVALVRIFQRRAPATVTAKFSKLQIVSAAYMAFSHGSNDGQKTMGIVAMALVSYYGLKTFEVPVWVILTCALAIALGTAAGGWRIIKTLGVGLVHLRPIHGFAAEATAGTVIEIATRIGLPISTTHTISSSVMGVGASKRLSAVRWGIGGDIVMAWILTLPACVGLAWGICTGLTAVLG